jgi:hypothetical protein
MRHKLLPVAAVFLGTLLSGCAMNGAVLVRTAPPPPRYALVGAAPGPGYVWTAGYWDWRGANWVWVEGRWMRPPRPHAVWVGARWTEARPGRWAFQRGHWR